MAGRSQCELCACNYRSDEDGCCQKIGKVDPAYCTNCDGSICQACKAGYQPDGPLCVASSSDRRRLLSHTEGLDGSNADLTELDGWSAADDAHGFEVKVCALLSSSDCMSLQ